MQVFGEGGKIALPPSLTRRRGIDQMAGAAVGKSTLCADATLNGIFARTFSAGNS